MEDASEIEETQCRLERALEELAIVKREEEELLQQKVLDCRQEYMDAMTRLQEQFIAQVQLPVSSTVSTMNTVLGINKLLNVLDT